MKAPVVEVADIIRQFAPQIIERQGAAFSFEQLRALRDIAACRTAALGGHVFGCADCGHRQIAYNSCRNRHCPKCQAAARAAWLAAREQELLPVPYFHVVFTLPPEFNELALQNPRAVYGLLFQATSQTLLRVARHPDRLGAKIGFLCVLHTWGQNLMHHPHLHCVIPGGGLSPTGTSWIPCRRSRRQREFFLPVRVLSRVFRGKFIAGLKRLFHKNQLKFFGAMQSRSQPPAFENLLNQSVRRDWVVYAKRPFGGPRQVLKYLARYTHRVAISNQRLIEIDQEHVSFHYKDYADGQQTKVMQLTGVEFLRRFLMHVLPRGFVRIRHYGFLANRQRGANLALCRQLLNATNNGNAEAVSEEQATANAPTATTTSTAKESKPVSMCPACGTGRWLRLETLAAPRTIILPAHVWRRSQFRSVASAVLLIPALGIPHAQATHAPLQTSRSDTS